MKRLHLILLLPLCILSFAGCTNSIEQVKFFDRQVLPRQTLTNAEILRSQHGQVQSSISAAAIEQYDEPEAKTIYPKGIYVVFFSDTGDTNGTLRANYAISWDSRNIMLARDSVVLINNQSGDTVYLKELVWNREEGRVFSNYPLHAHNGPQVTHGDSFHSDDSLKNMQIVNQRGVFVLEEEEEME